MREVPDVIYLECPDCDDITAHDVLKGKMGKASLEGTMRCQECNRTFTTTVMLPKIMPTKVIVSNGRTSEPTTVDLESDDLIVLDDEFFLDDGRRVKVTGIDVVDGRKVKKAPATDVKTIWGVQFDVLNIKVSINDVQKTYAKYIEAEPDDEYTIGDTLHFENVDCLIHSIKIRDRMLRRGTAEARDIVRIYGKLRKKTYDILDMEEDDEELDINWEE